MLNVYRVSYILNTWCFSHKKLNKLITQTTALSNSVKLWAMPCRATQDGQVMVESSDKMWSTGEGNGKPLQYSCLENPMNSMKRQKDWCLKINFPGRLVPNMLLEESGEITPERMKRWSQSKNNAQLWMWLVMEVKSDAVKNNYCIGTWNVRSMNEENWKWSNRRWQEWTSTF